MKNGCLLLIVLVVIITGGLYLNKMNKDAQNDLEYEKMKKEYNIDNSSLSDTESDSILNSYMKRDENALIEIKKETKVKDVYVTESNILYVGVSDDGTKRNGYASYLCEVLREYNSSIKKVRVVKFGSENDNNRDDIYGTLLGESECNY